MSKNQKEKKGTLSKGAGTKVVAGGVEKPSGKLEKVPKKNSKLKKDRPAKEGSKKGIKFTYSCHCLPPDMVLATACFEISYFLGNSFYLFQIVKFL
jgi:hypothetical protein